MTAVIRSRFRGFAHKFISSNVFHPSVSDNLHYRLCFHTSAWLDVAGQEIRMPSLSPTMSEGTIVKWIKKEGDTIAPGDVLCEIQTDKAVMSFETEEEGVLAKILINENTKDIKVGTLIALMVAEGEDWRTVELPSDASPQTQTSSVADSEIGGSVPGSKVTMPSLSPTMTVGTIVKWHKKEGDTIAAGDVLCDIQTDKAVMSFETEDEGILAKILVPEGTTDVKVGTLIALTVGEGEDWTKVSISGSTVSSENSQPSSAGGGTIPGVHITMPSLSPTMTEGTIVKWHKKEGDAVSPGDVLCDIQTDKAVMSLETEEEGILAKILLPDGSAGVKVGNLIALMVTDGENWQDVMIPGSSQPVSKPVSEPTVAKPAQPVSRTPQNYGPAVRTLLDLYQLDSSQITATGRNKKLLKSDVLSYITERKLLPKPPLPVPLPGAKSVEKVESVVSFIERPSQGRYVDIELSSMRKTIAKRLTESKMSIPHAYAAVECNIDALLSFRKQMKSAGVVVSVNDFVIKAVALALKECPLVNCLYINDQTIAAPSIDISVAVATDSGLITPIVKNANVKSIDEISAEVKALATRAKAGKLQLHEFQGGSFTISNLGMFGISEFTAIINPPQCAILAVGGGQSTIDIKCNPVTKMTSTLSFDARAISESAAVDFLEMFQSLLENPANILIGLSPKRTRAAVN